MQCNCTMSGCISFIIWISRLVWCLDDKPWLSNKRPSAKCAYSPHLLPTFMVFMQPPGVIYLAPCAIYTCHPRSRASFPIPSVILPVDNIFKQESICSNFFISVFLLFVMIIPCYHLRQKYEGPEDEHGETAKNMNICHGGETYQEHGFLTRPEEIGYHRAEKE